MADTDATAGPGGGPGRDRQETEAAKAALQAALNSPEFQTSLRERISGVVAESVGDREAPVADPEAVTAAVAAAIKKHREESRDPYRAPLLFLAAVIGFSLALFVGLLSAWPADETSELTALLRIMIGWTAVVIFVATLAAFIVQTQKFLQGHRGFGAWIAVFLMLVVVAFGLPSALYPFQFGFAGGQGAGDATVWTAIDRSFCEVRVVLALPPC